ncbi:hypothetical protein DER45DRAFT_647549 [Fusarium avenaceum]|nr:hypothetical protein DER45DRAFT_647549 [Fusarium avenaceum]
MYIRWAESHTTVEPRSLDGSTRSPEIRAILITFSILSTTVVALRTYIRHTVLHSFGWDDGVMVVAQVFALGAAAAIGLENKYGLGYHTLEQPKDYFIPYMKAFYASVVVYNVGMCLVKIAILLQYRRVFSIRIIQQCTLYGLLFMGAWTITIAFINILICIPVAKFWNATLPGHCSDALTIWYVMAGFNLVTDIFVFCLPLPVIRSLKLPKRQKAMLLAIFSVGFLTCITSIVRIRTLKTAASTKDPNWDNVDAATWSFLEVTLAIIAACLPTLRPLFSKLMPRIFGSSYGRSNGPSTSGQYAQSRNFQYLKDVPRTRTEDRPSGSMEDTTALREDVPLPPISHNFHGRTFTNISVGIPAPSQNFNEKEGSQRRQSLREK